MYKIRFIAAIAAMSIISPSLAALPFTDVRKDDFRYEAIEYLYLNGIVSGYSYGKFAPYNSINRVEFLKIALEAKASIYDDVGPPPNPSADCFIDESQQAFEEQFGVFKDIDFDQWYAGYFCYAMRSGIIQGYPDGTFRPNEGINLVEASKIIVTVFDLPHEEGDVWYEGYVRALTERGAISKGYLNMIISRRVMAEIIFRLMTNTTNKDSVTYEELSGDVTNADDFIVYEDKKIHFEYPDFYVLKNESPYKEEGFYRIELYDGRTSSAYLTVELNNLGWNTYRPDVVYTAAEKSDGSIHIVDKENFNTEKNQYSSRRMYVDTFTASNGNTYTIRFAYKDGEENLDALFFQILESVRLLK